MQILEFGQVSTNVIGNCTHQNMFFVSYQLQMILRIESKNNFRDVVVGWAGWEGWALYRTYLHEKGQLLTNFLLSVGMIFDLALPL